jgi:uncharacterized protein (DUF2235 family)
MRPVPQSETEETLPAGQGRTRGRVDHLVILDGTFSSLRKGEESNAGLTFHLLAEGGPRARRSLYYEEGIRWQGWRRGMDVINGVGIDGQICRAYGHLASHYREGDRIFLFGYSRGAFAVRSLAGVIDRIGLLRHDAATERNVTLAYRHYRQNPDSVAAQAFARAHCHIESPIEMVGVWDTVKALGLRLPLLWMLTDRHHAFHNHHLGPSIRHGFHALALDETRAVFEPVLWDCPPGWEGNIEQVWFRGAHGDVGGQLGDFEPARPLSNIPLVWMLDPGRGLRAGPAAGLAGAVPLRPAGADGRHLDELGQVFPAAPPPRRGPRPQRTAARNRHRAGAWAVSHRGDARRIGLLRPSGAG